MAGHEKQSNIGIICLTLLASLFASQAQAQTCDDIIFERVGCYKQTNEERSPMSVVLFTDRDKSSKFWSGIKYAFQEFNIYLPDLACRCAKATTITGYVAFGLQNYGECYSTDDHAPTFSESFLSSKCATTNFGICQDDSSTCVGQENTIFVYKITASGKPHKSKKIKSWQKALSEKIMQKKVLRIAKSSKSSIEELECSSYRLTILLNDASYTTELESYQSSEFMDYRRDIELAILQAYDGDEQFQKVQVLRFSPGFEMKVVSTILLKFKAKSKHLIALVKKMGTLKFGKLRVFPAVGDCGCYGPIFKPTPLHPTSYGHPYNPDNAHKQESSWLCAPECKVTCSSTCTPNCCTTVTPSSVAAVGYSIQCTAPCGAICAPSCTPACCYTIYREQRKQYMYRKRHQVQNKRAHKET